MGKWDHRRSRRFFRRQRSPLRLPIFYDINAPLPDFSQDGIPLWEKKYCTLIGSVPWQKIVDSKEYIYGHNNVLNWNDSAAKEAFQNAKNRYWAEINSLTCDISLPDPDTYVDQIDWNPYIDPELIKELDSAYFPVPDEEQENAINIKRTKISVNDEDPWEFTGSPSGRALENKVQGCSQGDYNANDSGNVDNTDNPWECSITQGDGVPKDNAWEGGCVKPLGWNERKDHNNHFGDWNSGYSPWGNDCKGILSRKDKGLGIVRDSSSCPQQSNNLVNISNPWERKSSQQNVASLNTEWRNNGANVPGLKQWEYADVSSNSQFRRNYGGRASWNQSFQRREGSNQHTLGHNSSQFQRDNHQTGHCWRRENGKKRYFGHY